MGSISDRVSQDVETLYNQLERDTTALSVWRSEYERLLRASPVVRAPAQFNNPIDMRNYYLYRRIPEAKRMERYMETRQVLEDRNRVAALISALEMNIESLRDQIERLLQDYQTEQLDPNYGS